MTALTGDIEQKELELLASFAYFHGPVRSFVILFPQIISICFYLFEQLKGNTLFVSTEVARPLTDDTEDLIKRINRTCSEGITKDVLQLYTDRLNPQSQQIHYQENMIANLSCTITITQRILLQNEWLMLQHVDMKWILR